MILLEQETADWFPGSVHYSVRGELHSQVMFQLKSLRTSAACWPERTDSGGACSMEAHFPTRLAGGNKLWFNATLLTLHAQIIEKNRFIKISSWVSLLLYASKCLFSLENQNYFHSSAPLKLKNIYIYIICLTKMFSFLNALVFSFELH